MADPHEQSRLVVTFFNHPMPNPNRSREEGRPCFDDMEACRIQMSGDRLQAPVFPAHAEIPGEGVDESGEKITYAMKYSDQYKRFKDGKAQIMSGTPISELPFLTEAKRRELKALHIYTAETLAALDGQPLKSIGQGGRELKEQAQAYLDNAAGSANVTRLAEENVALRQRLEDLERERAQYAVPATQKFEEETGSAGASQFKDWEDELIKEYIAEKTGSKLRGNPNHATLVAMADELAAAK